MSRLASLLIILTSFPTLAAPNEKIYDISRDAFSDYKQSLEIASSSGKNIFVIAGGNWCHYCYELEKSLKEDSLDKTIKNDFIFMKANFGDGNDNEQFFSLFPRFNSYPRILIISSNGKLLISENPTSEQRMKELISTYGISF